MHGKKTNDAKIYVPHERPLLKRLGQSTVRKFLKDWEQYEHRISEANAQGQPVVPVSLVSSVDFDLLQSLVEYDTFSGVTKIEELEDTVLQKWLQKSIGLSNCSATADDLDKLVRKHVRYNDKEPNVVLRITSLFTDYRKFLKDYGLETLTETNPKLCTSHITSLLQPYSLRRKIENDLQIYNPSLRKKWLEFFKHVKEKAHCM